MGIPVAVTLGSVVLLREPSPIVIGVLMMSLNLLALVGSIRTSVQAAAGSRVRRAWCWVALAATLNTVVSAAYGMAAHRHGPAAIGASVAPWALVLRLLLAPTLLTAVLTFPAPPRNRNDRLVLLLDLMMVNGAAALAAWYFIIGPLAETGISARELLPMAIATGDVVTLCAATFVLLRGVQRDLRVPVGLLMGGMAAAMLPDLLIAAEVSSGLSARRGGAGTLVLLGMYLLALASWWRPRTSPAGSSSPGAALPDAGEGLGSLKPPPTVESAFPYLSVLVGCGLLVLAAARSPLYPWGGLTIGMILMTGALATRQLLSIQESRRRAVVDPVTRLANRAGLMEALERAHARSTRGGPQAAVLLLDLDGFKGINDQHGHEVGDEALIAFGRLLRRCVLGSDLVGRLGGDEFVIVLGRLRSPDDAAAVAERILAELEVPQTVGGMLLRLRTSIGIASILGEGDSAKASLARADRAMYEAKRAAGSRWARQDLVVAERAGRSSPG